MQDYRWHDNRHTFATVLLRATRNLRLVQKALDHADIETTIKYAHVLDEEIRAGMEAADIAFAEGKTAPWEAPASDAERDAKSRKTSRTTRRRSG